MMHVETIAGDVPLFEKRRREGSKTVTVARQCYAQMVFMQNYGVIADPMILYTLSNNPG